MILVDSIQTYKNENREIQFLIANFLRKNNILKKFYINFVENAILYP